MHFYRFEPKPPKVRMLSKFRRNCSKKLWKIHLRWNLRLLWEPQGSALHCKFWVSILEFYLQFWILPNWLGQIEKQIFLKIFLKIVFCFRRTSWLGESVRELREGVPACLITIPTSDLEMSKCRWCQWWWWWWWWYCWWWWWWCASLLDNHLTAVLHYMSQYYFCWDSVGMDI